MTRARRGSAAYIALTCATCKREFVLRECIYRYRVQTLGLKPKFCQRGCVNKNRMQKVDDVAYIRKLRVVLDQRVVHLRQMSPEKQAEMYRLYGSPKL